MKIFRAVQMGMEIPKDPDEIDRMEVPEERKSVRLSKANSGQVPEVQEGYQEDTAGHTSKVLPEEVFEASEAEPGH